MRLRLPKMRAPLKDKRLTRPGLMLAAVAFAAAELGLGLAAGFYDGGRAEPLLFLAFRPWLLLLCGALAAGYPLWQRAAFVVLALGIAALSEAALLITLGADRAWYWTGRGVAAGLLLAVALDLAFDSARTFFRRNASLIMAVPLLAIFLFPGGLKGYEAVAIGVERPAAERGGPDLLLMTALPIIWGEGGAFDPASAPASSYKMLQNQFKLRPLDTISDAGLAGAKLMLLAQPRALAPAELVSLDAWVREGGHILVLTDPALTWPTQLPLGDIRRPPPVGLLSPLLGHWGVAVEASASLDLVTADLATGSAIRRLALQAPGTLTLSNPGCAAVQPWLARCTIGKGKALILADADLMRDDLWAGFGKARHQRTSDNPIVVADLLDRLEGVDRADGRGRVDWMPIVPDRTAALLAALLPLALVAIGAALLRPRS